MDGILHRRCRCVIEEEGTPRKKLPSILPESLPSHDTPGHPTITPLAPRLHQAVARFLRFSVSSLRIHARRLIVTGADV
jgi:hypothetical protein